MTLLMNRRRNYITPVAVSPRLSQLVWFAAGAVLAFTVPYLFSDVLSFRHDVYYAVYFAFVGLFVTAYATRTHADVGRMFRQNWKLSLGVGVAAAAFVVFSVLMRSDGTDRPGALYLAFEVLWRGALYGAADAVLLTVFPALVALGLLRGKVAGFGRRVAFGLLALGLTVVITATYHAGYEQYREDGLGNPEVGNTVISVPTILSMNPIGSLLAHGSMHVTAVLHAYETEVYLPPQTDAD